MKSTQTADYLRELITEFKYQQQSSELPCEYLVGVLLQSESL